jgi:tetratricopeptide (TPR) repeat protein
MGGPPIARPTGGPFSLPRQDMPEERNANGVELRLAIGRDGIGIELATPAVLGCLRVVDLRTNLPGLRFPADVSGGVARFRHKRGELLRLGLEIDARTLEHWAAPRLRGLVGERTPSVWARVAAAHVTLCISDENELPWLDSIAPTLAFELHALVEEDIVLVLAGARGVNLPGPPTALAIACVEAILGRSGLRAGVQFTLRAPALAVLRELLPEAGARAPSAQGVRWTVVSGQDDVWTFRAALQGAPAAPTQAARRAQELAVMLRGADDLLVAGDLNRARAAYMEALERAPRHPEIVQRVADIDARMSGREEAVLALMSETAEPSGSCPFGITRSELLARIGQTDDALASFGRAATAEPAPALAARLCELAAAHAQSPEDAEAWLDRALATCPGIATARWARAQSRLLLGRTADALSDVQHLDAVSHGDQSRYDVWVHAGKAWQAAGLQAQAVGLFERALLHVPDDPEALGGLGTALVESGAAARGTSLLARAIELALDKRKPAGAFLLDLARALADRLGDLPTAIARVSAVPREAPEAILARGLEGRWRHRLGDVAGASLAFGQMREMASSLALGSLPSEPPGGELDELLREASELVGTQGHDASALAPGSGPERWSFDAEPDVSPESAERSARVEELTRRFQANPDDRTVIDELSTLLESLGRSHELLALLSARLDDARPEERAALLPGVRAALERLARSAEAAGRAGEASLYQSALDALVG